MACCIILSTTVGMPSRRIFPPSLDISTLRTGYGLADAFCQYVLLLQKIAERTGAVHTVYACSSLVAHYLLIGYVKVGGRQNLFQ